MSWELLMMILGFMWSIVGFLALMKANSVQEEAVEILRTSHDWLEFALSEQGETEADQQEGDAEDE